MASIPRLPRQTTASGDGPLAPKGCIENRRSSGVGLAGVIADARTSICPKADFLQPARSQDAASCRTGTRMARTHRDSNAYVQRKLAAVIVQLGVGGRDTTPWHSEYWVSQGMAVTQLRKGVSQTCSLWGVGEDGLPIDGWSVLWISWSKNS